MPETILVRIKGDEKDFVRATGKAGKAQKKFGGGVKALKVGLIAAAAAMTAMIVITKKLMKSFTTYALKIDKINKVTGMSTEALQKWGYVALQEHGNFETLTKAFTILAQRVVDADQGLETYTREFRAMGVALRDEQGNLRDVNDIFLDLGDYAKNATNQTEAMGHMGKILGSRYVKDLLPMLKLSREEIKRLGDEAERLGIVLDETTIRAAKEFDDKLTKLKERMRGLGLQIAEKLMPAFDRILDAIDESGPGLDGLVDSIANMASSLANFLAGEAKGILKFLSDMIELLNTAIEGWEYWSAMAKGREGIIEKEVSKQLQGYKAELRRVETYKELQELLNFGMKQLEKYMSMEEKHYEFDIAKQIEKNALIAAEMRAREKAAKKRWEDKDKDKVGVGKAAAEKPRELSARSVWLLATLGYHLKMADYHIGVLEKDFIELEGVVNDALEGMEDRAKKWVSSVQESLRFLGDTFSGFWDTAWQPFFTKLDEAETAWGKFGASIVKDLFNMLKQVATKVLVQGLALAAIVTMLNAIAPGVGTFLMKLLGGVSLEKGEAAAAGGFGGILKSLLGITGKQAGGRVDRRPYIVGERGAELFVPQAPGEIISNDALNRLASAMRPAEAPAGALGSPVTFVMEGDAAEILAAITRIYRQAPRQQQAAFGADVSEHSKDLVESV